MLCDKGMLQVDNKRSGLVWEHLAQGSSVPPIDSHFTNRYPLAYAAELEHFLDVMQGKLLDLYKEILLKIYLYILNFCKYINAFSWKVC